MAIHSGSRRARTPCENTYIGLFVYTLGVLAGREGGGDALLMAPSLLQQTPLDQPLGDVLGAWGGRQVLIEFKRTKRGLAVEARDKRVKLEAVRTLVTRAGDRRPADVVPLPDRAHWIAYGTLPGAKPDLIFQPYSTIPQRAAGRTEPSASVPRYVLTDFLARLRDPNSDVGVPHHKMRRYLQDLFLEQGVGEGEADDAGGFLVTVTPDGCVGLVAYEGFGQLRQQFDGLDERDLVSPIEQSDPPTIESPATVRVDHAARKRRHNRHRR